MSLPPEALPGAFELPVLSLDVEAQDLGNGVKGVGLELIETNNREPVRGPQAAEIWSAAFPALAASDFLVADFFSHLDRVREFCDSHKIKFREAAGRCVVLSRPSQQQLRQLFERFEGETFGLRAGAAAETPDAVLEGDLSKRGVDAYEPAYERYTFCAVCDLKDGWVTLLSATLWASEVIRRLRPALEPFDIYLARPQ
jgi:hypothetical protein